MLLEQKEHRCCAYCLYSCDFNDQYVLCEHKGPVGQAESCHRFEYDPLRRQPPAGSTSGKNPAEGSIPVVIPFKNQNYSWPRLLTSGGVFDCMADKISVIIKPIIGEAETT